jgi:hypothetical protein
MARCPAGHDSQASDYCDTCGLVIGGESPNAAATPRATGGASPGPAAGPGGVASPAQPGGGGTGSGCPVCQAERNGRFCEECGYDFDLAEAMPHVNMIAGVMPAPSGQQSAAPSLSGTVPVPEPGGEAEASGPGGQGLDLDAELARAESEAAAAAAAVGAATASVVAPGVTANVPDTGEPLPVAESGAGMSATAPAAETGREPSPGSGTAFPGSGPAEAASGLSALSISGIDSSVSEISLIVDADRDYYKAQLERGDIVEAEFPFPKYSSERRFTFSDGPVRIGRASSSRGLSPEIDLTGPPLDPAVSHLHAQLLRHPEGWVVVDLGSSNGTRLNDAEEPLEAETEIPVKAGDRIHLGVWTTITLE